MYENTEGVVNNSKEWCGCLYNPTYIVHAIDSERKRGSQTGWGQNSKFKIQMTRILYTIIFLMAQKASVARLSGLICLCCISDCVFYRKEKGISRILSVKITTLKLINFQFFLKVLKVLRYMSETTQHLLLGSKTLRY